MTAQRFEFPTIGNGATGRALLLAIDDYALPLKKNLCYYLSKPTVRPEPVLVPSRDNPQAPDAAATHFYGTVLQDGGKFRMWYYALHWGEYTGEQLGSLHTGPVCYAESDDGLHWVKPELGQVEFRGSRANNIIALPDFLTEGAHLIKDGEDPDPARRYKLVYNNRPAGRDFWTIRTATSPDGLHWTAQPELPIDNFIEHASFYKHGGLYIVNSQSSSRSSARSEGGHARGRQGYAWVSPDFRRWLPECCESFTLPEPLDPEKRGGRKPYDQVHLGVGAASFGNVLVGFYCIWHNQPWPTANDWFGKGTTSGDLGLVVSNDGLHFREPVKHFVYLDRNDSPPTPVPGATYEKILCQANGILNVGDETRIYHGRWPNTARIEDYYAEVALATLPRDRWGALGLFPEANEGSVWSAPVKLPQGGCRVVLNADAAQGMRVEIADARFALLPAFSGEQSGTVQVAGGLDCPVRWAQGDLSQLGGQTVRLRIHLQKQGEVQPRLYAVYLDA